ncbi:NIPSNAP family containing protein [Salegentibacter salinarum]|uniref:NIPSNAP family containing protein n=1 Tax=Salegentibacter salinarum TaxID=447422 RepID=A0A2N0TY31_9FLAO|nr:NIPSNAP family protein [Salegentibacter salinarum]PKD19660.1 NIPSNAP family containing protein [Salegentibacter salinarum]SKB90941.1 NIPSNAP protein [Salegentibacter salinarum]
MKYSANFKTLLPLFLLIIVPLLSLAQEQEYYELKVYEFENDEQIEKTENYLQQALMPGFEELGVKNIGVFKPKADSLNKLYVLIPYTSLEEFGSKNKAFQNSEILQQKGGEYISGSNDNPPYKRMSTILLKAFKDMPVMKPSVIEGPKKDRVYELRSYQSSTEALLKNKIKMFNEGGEIELFDELDFNAVFYGKVIAGPDMPNLMYLTTFSDRKSRDEHWESFGNSPVWKKMEIIPEYQGNVSQIDIHFLYPTEYSDY